MAHYGLKLWNWRIQFHWLKSLSHELQSERTSERSEQFGASEWVRANERTEEHMRSIWMRLRNKKRTLISGMTNDYCANPDPGRSNQLAGSQACFLVAHSLAKTPVFHLHRLMHQIYASLIPNPDPAHASVIFSVSWFPTRYHFLFHEFQSETSESGRNIKWDFFCEIRRHEIFKRGEISGKKR